MANPVRGEVEFTAGDKTWTLRYTANSLCELEDHMGKTTTEIISVMQGDPGVKAVRSVFWAGLIDRHPDMDVRQAGEIMTDAGGITRAIELIGDAFSRAFPASEEGARPQRGARAGNGRKS